MSRAALAVFLLMALGACQGSGAPQSTAERCSTLEMQIAAAEQNDSLQEDAKVEMIDGYQQEKAALDCP